LAEIEDDVSVRNRQTYVSADQSRGTVTRIVRIIIMRTQSNNSDYLPLFSRFNKTRHVTIKHSNNNNNSNNNMSTTTPLIPGGDDRKNDDNDNDNKKKVITLYSSFGGDYSSTNNITDNNTLTATISSVSDGGSSVASSSSPITTKTKTNRSSKGRFLFRGRIILFILAIVYGSLNVSMRLVFGRPDPPTASTASVIQGWFAVLCFLPLLKWQNYGLLLVYTKDNDNSSNNNQNNNKQTKQKQKQQFWWFALELALYYFATQALINISLVATPGARASFLVQMSVVFTPIVSAVLFGNKINKQVWTACFVALVGLFVLSYSSSSSSSSYTASSADDTSKGDDNNYNFLISLSLTWGDWCCLAAALLWSCYICRLSAWGDDFDETTLQFVKNLIMAVLYTLWMLVSFFCQQYAYLSSASSSSSTNDDSGTSTSTSTSTSLWKGWRDPVGWLILFYTALGPCTIADICQQKAQASVPAAETNVILSLEPVFTTILGLLILGKSPSLQELGGGLLIMIASILASCRRPSR
jgi:drug/metabolite transporter (DMT)-like permease